MGASHYPTTPTSAQLAMNTVTPGFHYEYVVQTRAHVAQSLLGRIPIVQVVRATYQSEHSSTSTWSKGWIPSRLPAHIQNGCALSVS